MEANDMVSVVLPVYNGERFISESIKSILNQSYQNIELIIVNDCSTDKTEEIIKEFEKSDDRIRVIKNSSNLKLPKSLNVGFEQAKGSYYTWTSDDNMYMPNAIETMVSYLKDHPDISMVYSDYTNINEIGDSIDKAELQASKYLLVENVCGASFMYTREIAEEVGKYDENLFLAEDYDYWIRISSKGKIVHLPENLYFYRCHQYSLTSKRKELVRIQTYKVLEKNFLTLYTQAKKEHLVRLFFNRFVEHDPINHQQTLKKLLTIDNGYRVYNILRNVKNKIMGIHWME